VQVNKSAQDEKQALVAFGANLPIGLKTPAENVAEAIEMLAFRVGADLRREPPLADPRLSRGVRPPIRERGGVLCLDRRCTGPSDVLHEIEAAFGRRRDSRWEARKMDLDLIALDDSVVLPDEAAFRHWHGLPPQEAAVLTPGRVLILPHPRLTERGFVLAPLAESPPTGGIRCWAGPCARCWLRCPRTHLRGMEPARCRIGRPPTPRERQNRLVFWPARP
jgi:2-amino-4-hydroxy-6-hydroxymethyldihydropteridine diphosphokinase